MSQTVREKRVGYKPTRSTKPVGQRPEITQMPSLDISGAWFAAAGFKPGDPVIIEVAQGVITIRRKDED